MKFKDLFKNSIYENIKEKDIHDTFTYLYENNIPIIKLNGYSEYYLVEDHNDIILLGENKIFNNLQKAAEYINESLEECIDVTINEDLAFAKFRYTNAKHDPKPNILVLDNDYIYNGKGKVVPGQHDILGYNINYSKNRKIDKQAIQEITTFAHMLKKDKKDIYERIKKLYPDSLKYIRHYKPQYIKRLKIKNGWFWKKASVADLKGDEGNWV